MDSTHLRAVQAGVETPELRMAELRHRLDRLIAHLDDTSLRATLQLMIAEQRSAVSRQASLVAMERLAGRNTAGRLDRLRELKGMQDELMAVYARRVEAADDLAAEEYDGVAISAATEPLSRSFTRFPLATPMARPQEREADVGSISSARVQPAPAQPEPASLRDRQGRNGARAQR